MDGPFEDAGFDYSNQPLPSLSSTLLQGKNHDNLNVHSIQVMLGLQHQQQHDMFSGMASAMEYKSSPQKLDGSPMHQELSMFQQGLESVSNNNNNVAKRKNEDVILLQSQSLSSTDMGTVAPATTSTTTQKKSDKKKNDNNGVKKKKTR